MAIIQTANAHHTSLLISEQIPDFVRSDHPKFVNFIEHYYEFLANNSLMQTPDEQSYYYGVDTASKLLQDIRDVDLSDLDKFIESFRRQYGHTFPQKLYETDGSEIDKQILYKNLVNFYRAVGTEDSFRMLFRLLFNEDIQIYYPKNDILVASGANYTQLSRIKVNYVDNLTDILSTKIIGANSGAYGTVEEVQVLPAGINSFVSGKVAKTSTVRYSKQSGNTDTRSGRSNTEIYDIFQISKLV